jgi:hypothetical protein
MRSPVDGAPPAGSEHRCGDGRRVRMAPRTAYLNDGFKAANSATRRTAQGRLRVLAAPIERPKGGRSHRQMAHGLARGLSKRWGSVACPHGDDAIAQIAPPTTAPLSSPNRASKAGSIATRYPSLLQPLCLALEPKRTSQTGLRQRSSSGVRTCWIWNASHIVRRSQTPKPAARY